MSAFWLCAGVTAVSACVSLGFALVPFRKSGEVPRSGDMYALARSSALAIVATVVLVLQNHAWLEGIALAMVIVQAGDAIIGAVIRDRLKTIGPATFSLINLGTLLWLIR